MSTSAEVLPGGRVAQEQLVDLPEVPVSVTPPAALLWSRVLTLASVLVTLFTLDQVTFVLGDFWLLQSLGLDSVFWRNFGMGARLYVAGFLLFALAVALPAYLVPLRAVARRKLLHTAFLLASVAALLAA
jgi:uncharacterized membrane protein YwzB